MIIENKYKIMNNNFSTNKNYSPKHNTSNLSNKNYSTIISTKYNSYSPQIKLPIINQKNNIVTKIKNASMKKSLSYLYKILFPEQKKTMEEFLNNFSYDKFLNRPDWKYTFYPFKDEDKIKKFLMYNNNIMRYYNNMKKPSKLKKEYTRKPRMMQIIEENYIYKNQDFISPCDEDKIFLNKSNSSIKLGDKSNEKKLGNKHEGEKNTSLKLIYKNNANNSVKNKNKANFGNINRANIPSLKRNKTYLSNIFLKKCKL
jgi:hypothetical protein